MDDELNECSPNADCLNTEGTYDCMCRTGYSGDGRNCGELRKERYAKDNSVSQIIEVQEVLYKRYILNRFTQKIPRDCKNHDHENGVNKLN